MTNTQTSEQAPRKRLRLWPGVVAVALQLLGWLVVPAVSSEAAVYGFYVGVFGGALLAILWWLFFSRAPWLERVGAIVLIPVAVVATKRIVHESIANGLMGMMLPIYTIPALSLALVASAATARRLSTGRRRASMVAAILLACGPFTLVRTGGIWGAGRAEFHWRWTRSPEERFLARAEDEPAARTTAPTVDRDADWPGFRGRGRDSVVRGVRIEADWLKSPPVELWRRKIGPGWSSFAVQGKLVYTQEQRGNDEDVACYDLSTGKLVWRHRDAARFWESNAGPGPRGTPTLHDGRVYTLGATAILNALVAQDGSVVWSRNVATDTGAEVPHWGIASSPLVVGELVIVAASGRLAAYDLATGAPRWTGETGGASYSSPQLTTIGGVAQVLLLSDAGLTSVGPADGTNLWRHGWEGTAILQPARTPDGDVLITTGDMSGSAGTRRLAVARGPAGWTIEERWTSRGLKPYFNDFVVHHGHAFGFDGSILACIDLEDGQRRWKGGRYGNGQLVLLPEQDVMLVLSEDGEVALVQATPDRFTELARFKAIEGKTWNHPALVGDVLLVRNGEEMAAFRLPLAGG